MSNATEPKDPLNLVQALEEVLSTPEGKATAKKFFENWDNKKYENRQNRRIKKHFKGKSKEQISKIIDRIIAMHYDEYDKRSYSKGIEPGPNNLLYALFNFTGKYGKDMPDEKNNPFDHIRFSFCGYIFRTMWGQGTAFNVFKGEKMIF